MLNDIAVSAESCDRAGDKTWVVGQGGTRVRDLKSGAVGDGFEEAEKRDFVRRKARCEGAGRANLRDVDGAAGESREDETVGEGFVGREAKIFGRWFRHDEGVLPYHAARLKCAF